MARIAFNPMAEEITGKLAGSVFQDSYFGMQVRGLPRPRNPRTPYQQLRRGDFRFLSAGWRNLTTSEKNTWIAAAGTVPAALRLYVGSNINLTLIGQPTVSNYVPGTTPVAMPLAIDTLTPVSFQLSAAGSPAVVPAGLSLLLYATADKKAYLNFTNPADYQPIKTFPAGTDFSSSHNVIIEWYQHYGIMHLSRRICIKSVLINASNGDRGAESITCAIVATPVGDYVIDNTGYKILNYDGGYILSNG